MKDQAENPIVGSFQRMRPAIVAVGLFSLAINLLALTVPMHMLHVYDHVLTSRSGSTLLFLTLLAGGLLVALGLLEMLRSRVLVRLGNRLDHDLGDRVFAAALADRLAAQPESPAQNLRDLETLRSFLAGSALPVLFDAPWAPVFIAATFLLHPWLGLAALTGAVVLAVIAFANATATRRLTRAATADSLAAAGFADQALRNAEAIEAMGMRPAIVRRWRLRHGASVGGQAGTADLAGGFTALAKFWRPFLQIGLLSLGAWLVIEQAISPGVMIASSIIVARALAPVEGAIASWRSFVAARAAYLRLRDTFARHRDRPSRMALPEPRGELRVNALFVAPPKTMRPVLKGVSLTLQPGEILGVIGPSASGKSTLARALVGAWPALSGDIRIDGATLADIDRIALGRRIGYLPQDIELFEGTVADNIARFGDPDPAGVVAAAKLAGLHDMILGLPQAYDTLIGSGGEALSGGQRQRIALARALYSEPVLVVLDEPNASLDAEGEAALISAIAALKARGAAVVVIAHRPSLIAGADTVLVLRDGSVDLLGPRAEVMSRFTRPVAPMRERGPQAARPAMHAVGQP